MVRALLVRGMVAGAFAGLLAFGFAWVFGEPQVDLAIGLEQHMTAAAGKAPEPELISRAVQGTVGLLTGVLVYGCALGGIFSLVFSYAYHRLGILSPRGTAAVLAALGFATLILIPQIKYPASPPSIGEPETIATRTALYFTMIALSVITAVAATSTARHLAGRIGEWNSAILAVGAYLVVVTVAMLVLPTVDEVPGDFSAVALWNFRIASLGIEAVLWSALGLIFGLLAARQLSTASTVGQLSH